MGELALFFARRLVDGPGPRVDVARLDGWTPDLHFDACSLPWVPPSPNMPTPETALAYVGTCLFEGTNLNEGRGTDTPFLVFGAPWLDAGAVADAVPSAARPGVALEPVTFTPRSMPGKASSPRYRDEACRGLRLRVENRDTARPFSTAVAAIQAIRRRHPGDFAWKDSFDVLAGGSSLREAIEQETPLPRLERQWAREHARFREAVERLYEEEEQEEAVD
jgi:uncharacterized protein YbbC (DUF1343 family)